MDVPLFCETADSRQRTADSRQESADRTAKSAQSTLLTGKKKKKPSGTRPEGYTLSLEL